MSVGGDYLGVTLKAYVGYITSNSRNGSNAIYCHITRRQMFNNMVNISDTKVTIHVVYTNVNDDQPICETLWLMFYGNTQYNRLFTAGVCSVRDIGS